MINFKDCDIAFKALIINIIEPFLNSISIYEGFYYKFFPKISKDSSKPLAINNWN